MLTFCQGSSSAHLREYPALTAVLLLGLGTHLSLHGLPEISQGEGVEPTSTVTTSQNLFEFRSGFWINLHHYLFLQAVLATPEARKGHEHEEDSAQGAVPQRRMSAAQKVIWDKACRFYMRYGNRDPLGDRELVLVNYELSDAGNSPSLTGRHLSPDLAATLEEAAPVYRALWWKEHDRLNRVWISAAALLVAKYGPAMARRITGAFETRWEPEPVPVEVVVYANWAGAYTVTNSTLITISCADPTGPGDAALETLFHEASHALIGNVESKLDSDIRAAGKTPDFGLVHAIIFYTAGAVTLEALGKNADGYVPAAIRYGIYDRVPKWKHYRQVCKEDWQPYLDGKASFEDALVKIAHDI